MSKISYIKIFITIKDKLINNFSSIKNKINFLSMNKNTFFISYVMRRHILQNTTFLIFECMTKLTSE